MLIDLLMGEVSKMVTLAWLLDFRKAICRNDPGSQLSYLDDPCLIELLVFGGINDGSTFHYQIVKELLGYCILR